MSAARPRPRMGVSFDFADVCLRIIGESGHLLDERRSPPRPLVESTFIRPDLLEPSLDCLKRRPVIRPSGVEKRAGYPRRRPHSTISNCPRVRAFGQKRVSHARELGRSKHELRLPTSRRAILLIVLELDQSRVGITLATACGHPREKSRARSDGAAARRDALRALMRTTLTYPYQRDLAEEDSSLDIANIMAFGIGGPGNKRSENLDLEGSVRMPRPGTTVDRAWA